MSDKCRLCDSKKIKLIKKGVRDNQDIDVFKCQNCGLEFLSKTNQANEQFYENGQMHASYDVENWFKSTLSDDKRRAELLKKYIKNKDILDFGTGNGGFLLQAQKYTKNVFGYDLDKSLAEHYKKYNLDVKNSMDEFTQKFDVITMFHVLEHIENPEHVLEKLKNCLKPNGKVIIEIPNSNDALLTLYKSEAFKNFTYWSCHLYAYNEKNIKKVISSAFKIDKITHLQRYPYTNHIGWLKDKKAGGQKRYKTYKFINYLYVLFLKLTKKTDTLLLIAS
ncbi:class I SAM-dependent methyltransferase [bacterium]|nr:class I SAM-dependent methyltransferase [bacterium]